MSTEHANSSTRLTWSIQVEVNFGGFIKSGKFTHSATITKHNMLTFVKKTKTFCYAQCSAGRNTNSDVLTRWTKHKNVGHCSVVLETFPLAFPAAFSRPHTDCTWLATSCRHHEPTASCHSMPPQRHTPVTYSDCPASHHVPTTTWNTTLSTSFNMSQTHSDCGRSPVPSNSLTFRCSWAMSMDPTALLTQITNISFLNNMVTYAY